MKYHLLHNPLSLTEATAVLVAGHPVKGDDLLFRYLGGELQYISPSSPNPEWNAELAGQLFWGSKAFQEVTIQPDTYEAVCHDLIKVSKIKNTVDREAAVRRLVARAIQLAAEMQPFRNVSPDECQAWLKEYPGAEGRLLVKEGEGLVYYMALRYNQDNDAFETKRKEEGVWRLAVLTGEYYIPEAQ